MKKLVLFIIFFSIFSSLAFSQEVNLTLQEAVSLALRGNRDILLKEEELKKAKLKIAESQAALLPAFNLTGSWTDTRGYYNKELAQATTQTTLKQYLYKGGEILNTIKYDGYKFEVDQAILDKTKLDTVLSVKKAFYTLHLAKELYKLDRLIFENTLGHLKFIRSRFNNGQASESEVLQLESSLSTVEQAYEGSLNQVKAAEALLVNLLYLDESVNINTEAEFNYTPKEVAFEEGFLEAMQSRPEIRQYQAQAQADKANIEIAKAANRPQVYASWDYYSRSHILASTARGWNDYNVVGLTVSWPIFDGWATKSKVEQAIVDLKQTQLNKEKAVADIALELKNAYLDLKDAIAEIKSAQSEILLYKDNLAVLRGKYNAGQASQLDLDDTYLSYEVSLFNQKQAVYDYILAAAEFDKATGGL